MKHKILLNITGMLLSAVWAAAASPEMIEIKDMGGRTVSVPVSADNVYCRSPVGTLLMYSLNPGKIAGQNWRPTQTDKEYLDPDFIQLPVLSGWFGSGNVGNIEEILKAAPDLIIYAFYQKASPGTVSMADRMQKQLNIPVVLVNSALESLPESYAFVGRLISEQKRAARLAGYARQTLTDLARRAASIEPAQRVSLYYAEGPEGLQTDPAGSSHARVIDMVGAVNIAQVKIQSGMGRTTVSQEQLLLWNPDVIIACRDQGCTAGSSTYSNVLNNPVLSGLKAVRNHRVYQVPCKPFNFIDRPPSINRLIGLKWLGHLLYPETFDYDVRAETVRFYQLFYNINLTQEQLNDLFNFAE